MSDPTTLVSAFNSSLAYTDVSGAGTWTGVDPIRYSGGLWVEEATTNLCTNPSIETATAPWSTSSSTLAQSTSHTQVGSNSMEITATGANAGASLSIALAAATHALSCYAYNAAAATRNLLFRYNGINGSPTSIAAGTQSRVFGTCTGIGSSNFVVPRFSDSVAAEKFYLDAIQIEQKAYSTSYCDGSLGAGYAWTGTDHASTSTRAASSASVATANHISPTAGSLAFRFTRKIDTGGTETILECGTAGSGTDYLSIYVNSSDKLVVSWNSDNAGAQTVTSTGSIAVDTEYLVITKWNGTSVSLSLNVGTPDTGTRDAVQGSWGAGALKLEASAGGAIFNGLLVANRRTTQREDAALYNRPTWSARTLRDRIAIGSGQLRPIGA